LNILVLRFSARVHDDLFPVEKNDVTLAAGEEPYKTFILLQKSMLGNVSFSKQSGFSALWCCCWNCERSFRCLFWGFCKM